MKQIVLYDIDRKIPNIALMKISSFYKKKDIKLYFLKVLVISKQISILLVLYFIMQNQ